MHRMALSRTAFALVLLGATLVGVWACSDKPSEVPSSGNGNFVRVLVFPPKTQAGIESADGATLRQGGSVDITVLASSYTGAPGTGRVTINVTAGELDGAPDSITLPLINGRASVHWACSQKLDETTCSADKQRVDVLWLDAADFAYAEFTGLPESGDGGLTIPDAGPADAGPADAGYQDAGPADANMTLVADRTRLFSRVGEYATLTATLRDPDAGMPMADKVIEFTSTNGGLTQDVETDGGLPPSSFSKTYQTTTNGSGVATARVYEAGIDGNSTTVEALHEATNARMSVDISVVRVRQISWTSTMCGGSVCTMMGVKGSGFNEQAQVTFKVVDSTGAPVPGIDVEFSIPNAPPDTRVSPKGTTDGSGNVTANVSAGRAIGAFMVRAVVIPGEVEVTSTTIPIRGAKPANLGFSLICSPRSIPAFVAPGPDRIANIDVPCLVKLVDRYGNSVGTGTTVGFKSEAGTVPNDIVATAYAVGTPNTTEGTATITFNTIGPKPEDVEPFPAEASQRPHARTAEPFHTWDSKTFNPRDGLVTIIAYVRGEEFFWDNNGNGIRDADEPFIDQGEPFVDSNDNGVWDPGEIFIDEGHDGLPPDHVYNGPNGRWDDDTTIWVETRIIYSGAPYEDLTPQDPTQPLSFVNLPHSGIYPNPFAPACPGGLERGSGIAVTATRTDVNYNRMAASTTFSTSLLGGRGTLTWTSYSPVVDDFGIDFEHILLDATTSEPCRTGSSTAGGSVQPSSFCNWRMVFYGYEVGTVVGDGVLEGAPLTDTSPCKNVSLRVSTQIGSVTYLSEVSMGGIK